MPFPVNLQTDTLSLISPTTENGFIFIEDSLQAQRIDSSGLRVKDWHGLHRITDISVDFLHESGKSFESQARFRNSVLTVIPPEDFPETYPHQPVQNAWLSLFFTLGIVAAGAIKYYNKRSFNLLLKSTFSNFSLEELLRERQHLTGVFFTAPFLLSCLIFGITFAYILREQGLLQAQAGTDVLLAFISIISVQIIKHGLIKLLGNLFETVMEAERHVLYHHQFFCISGWIFLPMLGFALFSPVNNVHFFHILTATTISLSALYTSSRLIVNYSYKGLTNTGLFILYICSTEILPVLTVLKLIYLRGDF